MKIKRPVILLVAIGLLFSACQAETKTPTQPVVQDVTPTTSLPTEVAPARFTLQADVDLVDPVTALYTTYFNGEQPSFVASDPDLLAAVALRTDQPPAQLPATFLPNAVFLPQSQSDDMAAFIDFAISPAGQQALIDQGFLQPIVSITDQTGALILIEQPVKRLISTYGPATAMVYTVGAEEGLVAASYLGARDPLGAAAMTRIDSRFESLEGDANFSQENFNVEEAARLDPDLILTSARTAWLDTAAELGIQTVLFEAETPEKLIEAVRLTGQLLGPNAEARAAYWVDYYHWVTATLASQTDLRSDDERPTVLFTGTKPTRVASGEMYQTSQIEIAGGISVSAELTGYWNDVNLEQIAAWDPDVILVPSYGGATVEAITQAPDWQILTAVKAGRVYQMPKLVAPWDTPAPDSVLGIIWLNQQLFPAQSPLDCVEQTQYFYHTYYSYAITAEELERVCSLDQ